MSEQASRVFWRTADTKLIAEILKAKDPAVKQKIARDAGYDISAEGLEIRTSEMISNIMLNKPGRPVAECSSNDCSQNRSSQNVGSLRSYRQRFVFNCRPVI